MSDYPNSIFSIVPKVNKSPVEYNAEKTKTIFAEDINLPVAEIVAIENELGLNPKGSFESVADRLDNLPSVFEQDGDNAVLAVPGNVGLGADDPTEKLHLKNTAGDTAIRLDNSIPGESLIEKITNGDFASGDDYANAYGWSSNNISSLYYSSYGGYYYFDDYYPTASLTFVDSAPIIAGKKYRVSFTVYYSSYIYDYGVTPVIGGTAGTTRHSDGTYTEDIIATEDGTVVFNFACSGDAMDNYSQFDNVSVKLVEVADTDISWTAGVDKSDGSKFKISQNEALGTNDVLTITPDKKVGFNNPNPLFDFDFSGDINFTGDLTHNGYPILSPWSISGDNIYNSNGGNIGIGGQSQNLSRLEVYSAGGGSDVAIRAFGDNANGVGVYSSAYNAGIFTDGLGESAYLASGDGMAINASSTYGYGAYLYGGNIGCYATGGYFGGQFNGSNSGVYANGGTYGLLVDGGTYGIYQSMGEDNYFNGSIEISQGHNLKIGNMYFSSGDSDYVHISNNEWYNGSSWINPTYSPGVLLQITGETFNIYHHGSDPTHDLVMQIDTLSSNVTIPNGTLTCGSDVYAYGGSYALSSVSDERLKTNIAPISGVLEKLLKLNPVTFNWNDIGSEKRRESKTVKKIGLIAQAVETLFPEVVRHHEDGYLGIEYRELVPVLISAIQEQSQQINELKKLLINK